MRVVGCYGVMLMHRILWRMVCDELCNYVYAVFVLCNRYCLWGKYFEMITEVMRLMISGEVAKG